MKNVILYIAIFIIGILAGVFIQKYLDGGKNDSVGLTAISSETPVITSAKIDKHLYRVVQDQDDFFLVAYETEPSYPDSTMAKFARFNGDGPLSIKCSKAAPDGIIFESGFPSASNNYKNLVITLDTLPTGSTMATDGKGKLLVMGGGDTLRIFVGSLISVKNISNGIVIGYVDQNDMDFIGATKEN